MLYNELVKLYTEGSNVNESSDRPLETRKQRRKREREEDEREKEYMSGPAKTMDLIKKAGVGTLIGSGIGGAADALGLQGALPLGAVAGGTIATSKELLDRFKKKHPHWHKLLKYGTGAAGIAAIYKAGKDS